MAPENSNVFLLDDNRDYRDTTKQFLEAYGHHVPLEAGTLEEAEAAIKKFGEEHINVAVLDKNLAAGDERNHDGEKVGQMIKRQYPDVILIGNSSSGFTGADIDNTNNSAQVVAELVTKV